MVAEDAKEPDWSAKKSASEACLRRKGPRVLIGLLRAQLVRSGGELYGMTHILSMGLKVFITGEGP